MKTISRLLFSLFLFSAATAHAQFSSNCNLQISLTCDNASCTATTVNAGTNACSGLFYAGFFSSLTSRQLSLTAPTNDLGLSECFDPTSDPQDDQEAFSLCFGPGFLPAGGTMTAHVHVAAAQGSPQILPVVAITGVFDPTSDDENDGTLVYAENDISLPTCTPLATVPSIAQSGQSYNVTWTPASNPQTAYQIDESTSPDFNPVTLLSTVSGFSKDFSHNVTTPTTYYYRVRATNCGGGAGPNSPTISIVVQPPPVQTAAGVDTAVPAGSTAPIHFNIFVPAPIGKQALDTSFTAGSDHPYITVTPATGTIPPTGVTLAVAVNPTGLPPGANTGTISVTSGGIPVASVPVSVSLVTPVGPGTRSQPPGNALIIPVVTHVNGASSPFQSDVRLTNANSQPINYLLTFTPTGTNGTTSSRSTQLTAAAGQTIALNDIAKNFFGYGASGSASDVGSGSLEIRPVNSSSTETFASSRTYATTAAGTLGQFIAAVPFFQFAGPSATLPIPGSSDNSGVRLSLQQVAQSARFRTNLGLVEGSGNPASGVVNIYNDGGTLLKAVPFSLMPGEQKQINRFLDTNGVTLDDGRLEVVVTSSTGAVTAYASVLDNATSDPLAVSPVDVSSISATRYVLPGMANLNNGAANFHSDIRLFNGGPTTATVTMTYFPQGNPEGAKTATPVQIASGAVTAIDEALPTIFGAAGVNSGGAILITSQEPSSIVATGRTYSIGAGGGTYGQFIPGVTPDQGRGIGEGSLQLLQLEQSKNFRSNLGLAELTGNPVTVRIKLLLPDAKAVPVLDLPLKANEFRQVGAVITAMGAGTNVYNARISLEVVSGTGRVTAYGSVIDNATQDPTYVPAQ